MLAICHTEIDIFSEEKVSFILPLSLKSDFFPSFLEEVIQIITTPCNRLSFFFQFQLEKELFPLHRGVPFFPHARLGFSELILMADPILRSEKQEKKCRAILDKLEEIAHIMQLKVKSIEGFIFIWLREVGTKLGYHNWARLQKKGLELLKKDLLFLEEGIALQCKYFQKKELSESNWDKKHKVQIEEKYSKWIRCYRENRLDLIHMMIQSRSEISLSSIAFCLKEEKKWIQNQLELKNSLEDPKKLIQKRVLQIHETWDQIFSHLIEKEPKHLLSIHRYLRIEQMFADWRLEIINIVQDREDKNKIGFAIEEEVLLNHRKRKIEELLFLLSCFSLDPREEESFFYRLFQNYSSKFPCFQHSVFVKEVIFEFIQQKYQKQVSLI